MKEWQTIIPQTRGGVTPTLTASYEPVSLANIIGVDHYPKPCCLEKYKDMKKYRIRKLTPTECYRLMDVDEQAIDKLISSQISNTQHYKMAGNSIVVAPLYHIFRQLLTDHQDEITEPTLF